MPLISLKNRHLIHFHFFKTQESTSMYLTNTIRTFALSMIEVFLPIYIFELPNKIQVVQNEFLNNLDWILIFYAFKSALIVVLLAYLSNAIFTKINLRRSILISGIILPIALLLWILVENQLTAGNPLWSLLILLVSLLYAMNTLFYWLPFHILFARKASDGQDHFGKEVGIRILLGKIAQAIGPAIGGIIIVFGGFNTLFIISTLFLILASIPVLFSINESPHHHHTFEHATKRFLFNVDFLKTSLAFAGWTFDTIIYSSFWPIVLFFALNSFTSLGFLSTAALVLSVVFALKIGNLISTHGPKLIHRIGVLLNTISYVPRILLNTPIFLSGLEFTDRLTSLFYGIPALSAMYAQAKKYGESDYIIYREIAIHLSGAIISLVAIVLLPLLPDWKWIFILAAIGSVLSILIPHE